MTMRTKTFAARLAKLEALERAARQPDTTPAYACVHPSDWDTYADPDTPNDVRAAIAETYQLAAGQKWYIGMCMCDPPEACRVCADLPFLGANHAT